jgi:hypothetical protein
LKTVVRTVQLEFDSAGQIKETNEALIVPYILARECVAEYCGGRGFKPGCELQDAAWTLKGQWVVAHSHADSVFVKNRSLIRGQIDPYSVRFDDAINAVKGDVWFLKVLCDQTFLDSVRSGELHKDASAAYFCDEFDEAGKFGDDVYDFVQRNFMFGHVAVGVTEGRCPSPFCGMEMDGFDSFLRVRVLDPGLFVSCRLTTVAKDAKAGVYALVGKLKRNLTDSGYAKGEAVVRDFLFDVEKGWTPERADSWVQENHYSSDTMSVPETLDAASKLDPEEVLAKSRRLLNHGNMSSTGDRKSVMTSAGWGARHHDGAL